MGITAFILKYRLGRVITIRCSLVMHSARFGSCDRAPTSLAWRATASGNDRILCGGSPHRDRRYHFDSGKPDADDAIDRASSRPDFLILGYPVISFDPQIAHAGSVRNLLGENPDPELNRGSLERSPRWSGNAANVSVSHDGGHGGTGREQRPLLLGAPESESAGRNARLRERATWGWPGARRSGTQRLACSAGELAPGPRVVDA